MTKKPFGGEREDQKPCALVNFRISDARYLEKLSTVSVKTDAKTVAVWSGYNSVQITLPYIQLPFFNSSGISNGMQTTPSAKSASDKFSIIQFVKVCIFL